MKLLRELEAGEIVMTIPLGMVKVLGKLPAKKETYQVKTIGGTLFNVSISLMKKLMEPEHWTRARREYKKIKLRNKKIQRNIRNAALGASKKLKGLSNLKKKIRNKA